MFGDPHFMVPLQSKEIYVCFFIQGYPGLAFNSIYNKNFIINAHFVADSMGDENEATWISSYSTKQKQFTCCHLNFCQQGCDNVGQGSFKASVIQKITFDENGNLNYLSSHKRKI